MAAAWQVGIWDHPNPRCVELQKLTRDNGVEFCGWIWMLHRNIPTLPRGLAASRGLGRPLFPAAVGRVGQVALSPLQVAHLGWLEKRTVSALFEAPPTATVQDALQNFLRVREPGNAPGRGMAEPHSCRRGMGCLEPSLLLPRGLGPVQGKLQRGKVVKCPIPAMGC